VVEGFGLGIFIWRDSAEWEEKGKNEFGYTSSVVRYFSYKKQL